jgi:hypothetical protein
MNIKKILRNINAYVIIVMSYACHASPWHAYPPLSDASIACRSVVQASCEDSGRSYSQTVHHDQAHYDPTATNAHQKQTDGHWINPRRLIGET